MWKRLKTYSKISLLVLLVISSIITLLIVSKIECKSIKNNENNKIKQDKKVVLIKNKNTNYSKFKELLLEVENFNNREILQQYNQDKIKLLIGNSKKELENNFYDINIEIEDDINIYINKLWKIKPNNDFCEEEYVSELVDLFNECFCLNFDLAYKEKLKNNIIKNYIEIKQGLLNNKPPNVVNLKLDDINFVYCEDKGRLKLKIEFLK